MKKYTMETTMKNLESLKGRVWKEVDEFDVYDLIADLEDTHKIYGVKFGDDTFSLTSWHANEYKVTIEENEDEELVVASVDCVDLDNHNTLAETEKDLAALCGKTFTLDELEDKAYEILCDYKDFTGSFYRSDDEEEEDNELNLKMLPAL